MDFLGSLRKLLGRGANTVSNIAGAPAPRPSTFIAGMANNPTVKATATAPYNLGRAQVARVTRNAPAYRDATQQYHKAVLPQVQGAVKNAVTNYAVSPIANVPRALVDSPGEQQGRQLVDEAERAYGFSPAFKSLISAKNPTVYNNTAKSGALNGSEAGGFQANKSGMFGRYNGIHVKQGDKAMMNNTLLHEGLHTAWSKMPTSERQDYLNRLLPHLGQKDMIQHPSNPRRKVYSLPKMLDSRLSSYKDYRGLDSLGDINNLPESIQNEVHSYLPEYYGETEQEAPEEIKNYYSKYFRNF